ncbi:MAG: hypothetical protein EOP08_08225 [Proteobacteria bacterium]|nr:MAG: hypothetical protein EOP08_08225 [Pseudomonadota bacterium]
MADPHLSGKGSLKGLLIALAVAAVLFVTVVLPAEYGRDPTHVGRLLGLDKLRAPTTGGGEAKPILLTEVIGGNEKVWTADPGDGREPVPLPNPAVYQAGDAPPKHETKVIKLAVDGKTEVKTQLKKGKMVVYSWQVEGGKVYVDYHGHDPSMGDKFWVRYSEEDGVDHSAGSLVAPFDGEHGWFWLNVSEQPVTIRLTVDGYYDAIKDYGNIP